jgi:hypothetical protein
MEVKPLKVFAEDTIIQDKLKPFAKEEDKF